MKHATAGKLSIVMVPLMLAACATTPVDVVPAAQRNGDVGVEDLTATIAPASRIELAQHENFLPPLPAPDNPAPVYPPDQLARRLPPQAVCLRVSVDEDGRVASSAPLVSPPDCVEAGVDAQPFLAAARAAVSAWQYDPAVRCVFEQAPKPDYPTCVGARETPQAVSLTYRFVFEQQDGRGTVRTTH